MIPRSEFLHIMNLYKGVLEAERGVDRAFKKLDRDFMGFSLTQHGAIIDSLLKLAMEDECDWIGYYMYELDWGNKYKRGSVKENNKNIPLKTIEDLYNMLTKGVNNE